MPEIPLLVDGRGPDAESREWVRALSEAGRQQDDAIERLHDLLLHAARFEIARRRRASAGTHPGDTDDLAMQAADDALT